MELSVTLDDPEKEDLGCIDDAVLIAEAVPEFLCLCPGITRNDSVNKAVAEVTCFVEPCDEAFLKAPFLSVSEDDLLKVVAVLFNEFAGN